MSEFTEYVQKGFGVENLSPVMRVIVIGNASLLCDMSVEDKVKAVSLIDEIVDDLGRSDAGDGERRGVKILANLLIPEFKRGIELGRADRKTAEQKAAIRTMFHAKIDLLKRLTF